MANIHGRIFLAVLAGLIAMNYTADLARLVPLPDVVNHLPYSRSGLSYLFDIALMVGLLRFVGGVGMMQQWQIAGLAKPWRPAALMGLCLFAPITLVGLALGHIASDLSGSSFVFLGLLAPFAEEVTYRGLAMGVLLVAAGWRFWAAALLPSLAFGLVHVMQGESPMEMAGVAAITVFGSFFFGWLYQRFDGNLWPAVVMHVGMNGVWNLFDLGDNAIGGALGNALRAASLLGAIAFTLWGQGWLTRTAHRATND